MLYDRHEKDLAYFEAKTGIFFVNIIKARYFTWNWVPGLSLHSALTFPPSLLLFGILEFCPRDLSTWLQSFRWKFEKIPED